jgi:hypothetical protein
MSKTIAQLEAELSEIRSLVDVLRSGKGNGDAETIGKAVGEAVRRAIRPTQEDRLLEIERPAGHPRTIVDAVSQHTGAHFKAVIREDGTCETFVSGSYQYPVAWAYGERGHGSAWPKGMEVYTRDATGGLTKNLTPQAKQLLAVSTYQRDLISYVSRRLNDGGTVFPVEARADQQATLQALRDKIATAAHALTHEAKAAGVPTAD